MNNIMEYKGYVGSVEFSEKDGLFFGKVQGIRSLISYEGTPPETAYKGSLNIRFKNRDTHRRAAIYAIMHQQSLNSFIEEAVEEKLSLVRD